MRAIARERRASLGSRSPRAIFGSALLTWHSAAVADAALSTYVDGAAIATHTDLMGLASLTGSGTERLTYQAAAFGGRGAARAAFGTNGAFSSTSVLTGDAPHSLVIVAQLASIVSTTSLDGFFALGRNTATTRGTSSVGIVSAQWAYGGDDDNTTTGTSADTSPHTFVKAYDGTTSRLYIDGALVGSYAPGAMALSAGVCLGSFLGFPAGSGSVVDIAETMIVSGAISASQVARIGTYFKAKWGTP